MIVRRLKNTKKGEPYGVETVEAKDEDHAEELAQEWWTSGGTLACVVVREDGTVDAHYMRDYCVEARIPSGWKDYWKPPPRPPQRLLQPNPEPVNKPPVTLFNEEDPNKPAKPPTDLTICRCCGIKRPIDGYEEGKDRSPSGRMVDGRCPVCGKGMKGLTQMRIYQMYMMSISNP